QQLPGMTQRAFTVMGDYIDKLIDIKLLAIGFLRRNPAVLKDMIYEMGAPELKFMVRIGLLGAPMGVLLALLLQVREDVPVLSALPAWLIVVGGAAVV